MTVTNASSVTNSLSLPWLTAAIGKLSVKGSATATTGGVYTVKSAGNLSGTADNFLFVYQALTADGEIRARLYSATSINTAGVMIRESLTSGSKYVFANYSGGKFRWQSRTTTGGSTSADNTSRVAPPNVWVRVVRTGNMLYSYQSTTGSTWTLMSSRSISMAANIYVGFAATSGSASTLATSVFDKVTVTP